MTTDAADRIARLERQVELLLARVEALETENAEPDRRRVMHPVNGYRGTRGA